MHEPKSSRKFAFHLAVALSICLFVILMSAADGAIPTMFDFAFAAFASVIYAGIMSLVPSTGDKE